MAQLEEIFVSLETIEATLDLSLCSGLDSWVRNARLLPNYNILVANPFKVAERIDYLMSKPFDRNFQNPYDHVYGVYLLALADGKHDGLALYMAQVIWVLVGKHLWWAGKIAGKIQDGFTIRMFGSLMPKSEGEVLNDDALETVLARMSVAESGWDKIEDPLGELQRIRKGNVKPQ